MAGGNIPGNLAPIFVAAGNQYHIPPQVLAGVASVESSLGADKSTSSAGAVGLMQFLPGTARSIGINPYDDRSAIYGAAKLLNQYGYQQNPTRAIGAYNGGPGNPQYGYARQVLSEAQRLAGQLHGGGGLPQAPSAGPGGTLSVTVPQTVQSFDQAGFNQAQGRYIAGSGVARLSSNANPYNAQTSPYETKGFGKSLGSGTSGNPLFSTGLLSTVAPNPQDFVTTTTQNQTFQFATGQLQQLAGTSLANVHGGAQGYVNPIPGAVIGRTDQGVDAHLRPGAPIRAMGDSKVIQITPWYKGQPLILMQLTSGPQAGKYWYVAEQIAPGVRPGQTVRAGQPIGVYANSGTGLELGWGSPATSHLTLATAPGHGGYSEGQVTPEGANFRSFLGGLHG